MGDRAKWGQEKWNKCKQRLCFCALLALLMLGLVSPSLAVSSPSSDWVASWGSAQLKPAAEDKPSQQVLVDSTLRQVIHLSLGGGSLRLHLSNVFGESPLVLSAVTVARGLPGKPGATDETSTMAVQFNGAPSVSIPAGAEYLSDAIAMPAATLTDVVVTMALGRVPATLTFHGGSRATSFLMPGSHIKDFAIASAQSFAHWYFLTGVDVQTTKASSIVTFGDSITDGHAATTDGNDRWTDVLAQRLSSMSMGVVNEGIGGNRILQDGLGPNALARFTRDVLEPAGVRFVIILEGINDLGTLDRLEEHTQEVHDALLDQLEAAFRQMVERGHTHGIRVFGGTLMPYSGSDYYHPSARSEEDRRKLNQWIRTSGIFDGVIDFDALVRDPAHPERLTPAFDSGDHLHPGPAGYKRMGEGIPLAMFR